MSMIPSEITYGRTVYWSYHAQPNIRKESELGSRYKICSSRVGWVTPKGRSPQFTGNGSGVLLRLQTRDRGVWIDCLNNDVLSTDDLYSNFSNFQELCQLRRERAEEMSGRG